MNIFESIFSRRRKDLTLMDVKREEIKLNIRENQTISKLEKIEKEKEEIFSKGAKIKSPSRRRQLARQFDMKSQGVKMLERELSLVSKELTTIKALKFALERREMSKQGIGHILNRVDEAQLMTLLEDDKITQEVYAERLGEVLAVVNEAGSPALETLGQEGNEVMNVWQKMDDGEIDDIDQAIKMADQAIKAKEKKTGALEEE